MHHWIPLPQFRGSYLLATDSATVDTAVVFVHGFLGDAFTTWLNFQSMAGQETWSARADLYFFQYDGFAASIPASAARFLQFLHALASPPPDWFLVPSASLPPVVKETLHDLPPLRATTTFYHQFVLIGHSLGAVVVREAIKDTARGYERHLHSLNASGVATNSTPEESAAAAPRLLRSKLGLFAPAISGTRLSGLAATALLLGGIRSLAAFALAFSRSYAELDPRRGLIQDLRQTTEDLAGRFPNLTAFRSAVLWGEEDDIVMPRSYYHDTDVGRIRGKDHVSVCKPTSRYRIPLTLVERLL